MAVRQYIGARYVPIYLGSWSPTKTYEPLSVVTDGSGNSWTSRKIVPEGTPLVEGEYWALTGVFSGQVLQLSQRIDDVDAKLEDAAVKINDVDVKADAAGTAANSAAEIAADAATKAADAAAKAEEAISTAVSASPRKYILLGDSFGAGYVSGGTYSQYGFLTYAKTQWGSEAVHTFQNSGQIGTGNSGFTTALSFIAQFNDITSNMDDATKNQITDVTVLAGTNDYQATEAQIISAVREFAARVREVTPRAVVTIGLLGTAIVKNITLINIFKQAATLADCVWIDGLHNLFNDPAFLSDNVHLNEAGYQFYAAAILRTISSRECHFSVFKDLTVTLDSGVSNNGATTSTTIRQWINEDNVAQTIGQAGVGGWGIRVSSSKITSQYTNVFKIGSASGSLMASPSLVQQQFGSGIVFQNNVPVGYASFYHQANGDVMAQLHAVWNVFNTSADVVIGHNIQQQSILPMLP